MAGAGKRAFRAACRGWSPGIVLSALSACGASRAPASDTVPDSAVPGASTDAGAHREANPPDAADVQADADAPPPYPRVHADPTLTTRIVEGPAEFVGPDACTNELPAPGDRWCAFSRRRADKQVELWVFNASDAARTGAAGCVEDSTTCFRLTEDLWTGTQTWGPSYPTVDRFDGDTLIFHADAPAPVREPYEGPIYAWRPGWPAARRISTARGAYCWGHRRSPSVFCLDAADVTTGNGTLLDRPRWLSFDLLAGGRLDGATTPGPSLIERVTFPDDDDTAFRVRLTDKGDRLAYSSVPVGGTSQILKLVDLHGTSPGAPTVVTTDIANWEIAHDDAVVYFLRGFHVNQTGALLMADLPDGSNVVPIATDVIDLSLLGAHGDVLSDVDRGISFSRIDAAGRRAFTIMASRAQPTATEDIGVDIDVVQVATDANHTVYAEELGGGVKVSKVARNDGTGSCVLNFSDDDETYGAHFSDSGARVFWIEFGRTNSEEGWAANAHDCQQRVKFGDWVQGFALLGEDLVLFKGGDAEGRTNYLQYARLNPPGDLTSITPLVIDEEPTFPLEVIDAPGSTYVLYGRGGDAAPAIYRHGPIARRTP